jgi:pantoate--beta-alanine ligase
MRAAVREAQRRGATVGLVPTMGALHAGHLSLVDAARDACDVVVASVFVNPTQFAPHEDLDAYPRPLDRDLELLAQRGCDYAFVPDAAAMYRPQHDTFVEVGAAARPWEGTSRPTHFRGVATVVLKLFQIIPADIAFFGQKDYQQTLVVKQLVADLDVAVEIRVCPIVREPDGLAMSSRNAYLQPDQRVRAGALWRSLQRAETLYDGGERDPAALKAAIREVLEREAGLEVEYVACVAEGSVEEVARIEGPVVLALAVRLGHVRLIDNHRLG